jgi:KDO2-lipid IV(A) lauroyltransferase
MSVTGQHHLVAARAAGRGVIVVAPHLGNVNGAANYAAALGWPIMAVVEPLRPRAVHRIMARLRRRWGVQIVEGGPASVSRLVTHLRQGGLVVLLADRCVTGNGLAVPFFGQLTRLPSGPAALARRTGAVVLPMATTRSTGGKSIIQIFPPLAGRHTGDPSADIRAMTGEVAAAMERAIRSTPDQWTVLQRVWPPREDRVRTH